MKRAYPLILACLALLVACGPGMERQPPALEQQLRTQLLESCAHGLVLEKTVRYKTATQDSSETIRWNYRPDTAQGGCRLVYDTDGQALAAGDGASSPHYLTDELHYLTDYLYASPAFRSYFRVDSSEQRVVATLLPAHAGRTELKAQRLEYSTQGTVRSIQSHIYRSNALFVADVNLNVRFQPDGRLAGYMLSFRSQTQGKAQPTYIETTALVLYP